MALSPKFCKSEISLDTGDSASNAVVKRSVSSFLALSSVVQNVCVCILWTSCLRAKLHYYYMWPFAKKLYHGWMSTMTSSNEISWKLPPSKWRAGCCPGSTYSGHYSFRSGILILWSVNPSDIHECVLGVSKPKSNQENPLVFICTLGHYST